MFSVAGMFVLFSASFFGLLSLDISFAERDDKQPSITVTAIGTYESGVYDNAGAEIVSYDHAIQRLFVTNDDSQSIDVLDISNPQNPILDFVIDIKQYGNFVNSIDVKKGILAAAIEPKSRNEPGTLVFFDTSGNYLHQIPVGFLPDMVVFTPTGGKILVANEGEPTSYCNNQNDPEGSISIIDILDGIQNPVVNTIDFSQFNGQEENLREKGIRIFGPYSTAAQDLEPEYITILPDEKKAAITLQENNAIAIIDIDSAQITDLLPLGYVDHSIAENKIDVGDEDGKINITNWPIKGLRQPDSIDSFMVDNNTFLITANEGDPRNYGCIVNYEDKEEKKVSDIRLDPKKFPDKTNLQKDDQLGRMKISLLEGDVDNDGDYDELFSFGSRSFSIWTDDGRLIFDSADDFEQITASLFPDNFNANHYYNEFDKRSNNRGPEPEGVIVEKIGTQHFAFIGLERIGGMMIYNVTDPFNPEFIDYVNNRYFSVDPSKDLFQAGDLGPEGMLFIPKHHSPINYPLVVIANEVSGTTTIYKIE